jgi:predicted TIM-barrel fold metal-dependent hydrolase
MTDTALREDADLAALVPPVVSVDDHIVEWPSLWVDRLPQRLQAIGPRVTRDRVDARGTQVWGDVWHYEDVTVPLLRAYAAAGMDAEDVDMIPMRFDDMRPGCTDVGARLDDMDADGVAASVCFPNLFVRFCGQRFLEAKDKDLALLCVRAYNDAVVEEWAVPSGGRIMPSTIVPLWDIQLAVEEVRRNAARGCTSVCFSEIPSRLGLPSMYSGAWEPFFAECADTDTVINMHIGSSSTMSTTSDDAPTVVRASNQFGNSALSLSDWLLCGAFDRHPNLKIALAEGQAGWIPYLVGRLDRWWNGRYKAYDVGLARPPSTYLAAHVFSCVFDDPAALRFLDIIGEDNLCFETDYPHPDGSWPRSRASAWRQAGSLSEAQRVKILRTNGARLYRIDRVLREDA